MALVQTRIGLIERAFLEVRDVISEDDNGRYIATEWRLKGEPSWEMDKLVKRDGWVSLFRMLTAGVDQGTAGNGAVAAPMEPSVGQ